MCVCVCCPVSMSLFIQGLFIYRTVYMLSHHHDLLLEMLRRNKCTFCPSHMFIYSSLHMVYFIRLTWIKQMVHNLSPNRYVSLCLWPIRAVSQSGQRQLQDEPLQEQSTEPRGDEAQERGGGHPTQETEARTTGITPNLSVPLIRSFISLFEMMSAWT